MKAKPRRRVVTYVIQLPESTEAKRCITEGIRALVDEHRGQITGQSNEDEMTLAEMFEKRLNEGQVEEARAEAARIVNH